MRRVYSDSIFGDIANIRDHWGLLMGLGIAVMVLGVFAIIASQTATLAAVLTFGILLLAVGVVYIVHAFRARRWGGSLISAAVGAIYLVTGLLITSHPKMSAFALTILISAFLLGNGLFRIVASIATKFPAWGWVLTSGIVSVILGGIIFWQLPSASMWVIGLFVGIEFIFAGWSLVALASDIHNLPTIIEHETRMAA
jgi:uncharacterized membrane protein HdeD (DUF308 family)